jgi:hypothetical protein
VTHVLPQMDLAARLEELRKSGLAVYAGRDRRDPIADAPAVRLGSLCQITGNGRSVLAFGRDLDSAVIAALANWEDVPQAKAVVGT